MTTTQQSLLVVDVTRAIFCFKMGPRLALLLVALAFGTAMGNSAVIERHQEIELGQDATIEESEESTQLRARRALDTLQEMELKAAKMLEDIVSMGGEPPDKNDPRDPSELIKEGLEALGKLGTTLGRMWETLGKPGGKPS